MRNPFFVSILVLLTAAATPERVRAAAADTTPSVAPSAVAAQATSWPKPVAPAHGRMPVAFVLTEGAVMIDFAGPWEVFQDVMLPARGPAMEDQHVFRPYTVSDSKTPVRVSGGMLITPDYTFDDAPDPKIVVVPAQRGSSPKMLAWIRRMSKQSDVVMSVCTGAFKLGQAGVLDGKHATTYHAAYTRFQHDFPAVQLDRDKRFVQSDAVIYTSGGLSAGIDLALHIVDQYFGHDVAAGTARQLEYEGNGWSGDGSATVRYSQPVAVSSPADHYHSGAFGNWGGDLTTKDGTYRIAVHLWPDAQGVLRGSVDSVDEDENGAPIGIVKLAGNALHLETENAGIYDGRLDASDNTIAGEWKQNGSTATLNLARTRP